MELLYSRTNESLAAIVVGLDLKSDDIVYAIGGSGDQAFAILEYAGKVIAVDNNPLQIKLMKERVKLLERNWGKKEFLDIIEYGIYDDMYKGENNTRFGEFNLRRRNAYFNRSNQKLGVEYIHQNRISNISSKLDSLEIIQGDIFQEIQKAEKFSKVYLSSFNTSDWDYNGDLKIGLKNLFKKLDSNGIIYLDSSFFERVTCFYDGHGGNGMPPGFSVDQKLTNLVRDIEATSIFNSGDNKDLSSMFSPLILRKK
ncbi:Uncharacterised protein [uncultured archaeon]|nr:Uncharacterised protein [uncultured archaeon]